MKRSPRAGFVPGLACWAVLLAMPAACQNPPVRPQLAPVRYIVSLAHRPEHMVGVKIVLGPGASERDVQLPVWNALYQVRDFSQYVNWVRAKTTAGQSIAVRKSDKTTWHLSGIASGAEIEYEIFADQPGPFGAQLNPQHAFFNLAEILMYVIGGRQSPVEISFTDLPGGWRIATPLRALGDGFAAEDYDRLVDSPVEAGLFQESDFDQGSGHYRVVVDADPADYNMQKIVPGLRRLVAAATTWMADQPFQTYLFLYHFPRGPAGGGMEHAYSTAIDISAGRLAENPQSLGDLTAHEFFHLWNVKRIRPQSLEPIDYTKENYTRALWFSEGMTTTAANIIRLRAGLLDESRYLRSITDEIAELERRPAHLTQSAEESSLDAWLEKYDYYRLPARSISYYDKGDLLGVMLDLQVREATHGSASIRGVFQWMNENYARQGQFFPDSEGVRHAAEAVSHSDLGWFFEKYVAGAAEIPWDDFFRTVGLHLVRKVISIADLGFVATQNFDAPPMVSAISAGSAAEAAGLAVGDAILEINGQIPDRGFAGYAAALRPGEPVRLRVRNSAGERELQWTEGTRQDIELNLVDLDQVTPEQKARRGAWLRGETQKTEETRP